MRKYSPLFVLVALGCGLYASAQGAKAVASPVGRARRVLTTVAEVRALPKSQFDGTPVLLRGTLTYYQPFDGLVFFQDDTGAIFLQTPMQAPRLKAGDFVTVRGVTVPSGFATDIRTSDIHFEKAGPLPEPVPVSWRTLMQGMEDCAFVSVVGKVRSATMQSYDLSTIALHSANEPPPRFLVIDLQTDGGIVRVHMDDIEGVDPLSLLDAQVRLEGASGGVFDGKLRQTGAEVWVANARQMQVLTPAFVNPAKLPLTRFNRVMTGLFSRDESQRVHVRGSLTFYQPGLQMVLQTPEGEAILVTTWEQRPLSIGQVIDVVGFPDADKYSEALEDGTVLPTAEMRPIEAVPVHWEEALAGHFPYQLVSIEGKLAAEVHEPHEDTLVVQAGSHVFSALLPRTVWDRQVDQNALPDYAIGSTVRITGVCVVHAGGPWNTERWFDLELRSPDDVMVLIAPSWWTARRLLYLSATLLALVLAALFWALILQRKVRRQTEQIRLTMESEAARERRIAFLEKERGRVLEAINSMLNLDDVLRMILHFISTQMEERTCWCELAGGTVVGQPGTSTGDTEVVRRGIYSGAGERLGALVVSGAEAFQEQAGEALEMGASLAALAIDNRRLYETLVHRSQYDQLTNVANRFLLESRLDEALGHAKRSQTRFALVYIDLDQFKMVNDLYGHRVGDTYLQQVADRLSQTLRGMDTLARVGGDEFIALIPVVRNRGDVAEILERLTRCFDQPFRIDDYTIRGSASIGVALFPEDGSSKDELKRVADANMYAHKPHTAV
ncbi:MAG: diguanylate cyclase domain-containing protein [Acidobacteriota bacterium]